MAALILRKLGGMAPSANPTALPESTATYVRNLDLRFGDFRPLIGSANVIAATAGQSLHRFESTGAFITRPGKVSFVRGPIPNDATERTYYTGDGAPKVVDNTGDVRQLGVPAPTAAPAVALNVTDEYSEEEAQAARLLAQNQVINVVRGNMSTPFMGLSVADLGPRFLPPGPAILGQAQAFLSIPGTLTNGAFRPTDPSHSNLNDMRLGYRIGTTGGVTTAQVELIVRSEGMQLNFHPAMLQNIEHPVTGGQLIPDDMIESIVDTVQELIVPADQNRDACIERMKPLLADFLRLADSGTPGAAATRGEIVAFYERADINGIIGAGITAAVSEIIGAMKAYTGGSGTPLPITGDPGDPGYYFNPM